ncbi:MAG: NAD(P)H-dependent oxidoreductase [Phycisphaerales bacterium]|jgi:nitroreductase
MQTVDAKMLSERLGWRYAVKKFDAAKKIPAEHWAALENSLVQSPSSYGLQSWKFIVVEDPALRAKLRGASWNQSQITDASHMVVMCRRREVKPENIEAHIARICEVRGTPKDVLKDFQAMMMGSIAKPSSLPGGTMEIWTRSQVYIALGFFLSAAAMLGVDTCPMEGFDPAQYDEMLGLKDSEFTSVVVVTAGYRAADDWLAGLKKVRFEASKVIERR